MKRLRVGLSAVLLVFSSLSTADEWASLAITPGKGRIEIVSNYIIISRGESFDAEIPTKIQDGRRIQIRYKKDNDWITTDFMVAGISVSGDLCRLHSELPSRYNPSPSDTIYVKPCRYK